MNRDNIGLRWYVFCMITIIFQLLTFKVKKLSILAKNFKLENKFILLHTIKSNTLFYKISKYEIIPLTFGPSKVV
jgi:hypothetical protein